MATEITFPDSSFVVLHDLAQSCLNVGKGNYHSTYFLRRIIFLCDFISLLLRHHVDQIHAFRHLERDPKHIDYAQTMHFQLITNFFNQSFRKSLFDGTRLIANFHQFQFCLTLYRTFICCMKDLLRRLLLRLLELKKNDLPLVRLTPLLLEFPPRHVRPHATKPISPIFYSQNFIAVFQTAPLRSVHLQTRHSSFVQDKDAEKYFQLKLHINVFQISHFLYISKVLVFVWRLVVLRTSQPINLLQIICIGHPSVRNHHLDQGNPTIILMFCLVGSLSVWGGPSVSSFCFFQPHFTIHNCSPLTTLFRKFLILKKGRNCHNYFHIYLYAFLYFYKGGVLEHE